MSVTLARKLNIIAILIICGVLLGGYAVQFLLHEFPCPLCMLQRLGMLGVAFGAMLNLRFGIRPSHYAISLLSALFGGAVSVRQILLHIVPGTGAYGSAIFGLHLYTWAFIVFVSSAFLISVMLMFEGQFEGEGTQSSGKPLRGFVKWVFVLVVLITLANVVTTFLECGLKECPDNPEAYRYSLKT